MSGFLSWLLFLFRCLRLDWLFEEHRNTRHPYISLFSNMLRELYRNFIAVMHLFRLFNPHLFLVFCVMSVLFSRIFGLYIGAHFLQFMKEQVSPGAARNALARIPAVPANLLGLAPQTRFRWLPTARLHPLAFATHRASGRPLCGRHNELINHTQVHQKGRKYEQNKERHYPKATEKDHRKIYRNRVQCPQGESGISAYAGLNLCSRCRLGQSD